MLNRIILIGRVVVDPQLRFTGNGTAVTNVRIAVDRPYTNQQGEREADFIDVVCWRKLAEIVADNLGKGRLIAVDGRLQIRYYERDGQRHQAAEVYADTVRFLDGKRESSSGSSGASGYSGSSGYSGYRGQQSQQGQQGYSEPRRPVDDTQIPMPEPHDDVFLPDMDSNEPDDVPF
jgi:single-strand DNA-binding protein